VPSWQTVSKERSGLQAAAKRLRANVQQFLGPGTTVMTLSYSSTIRDALKEASASQPSIKVIVMESRPLNEGRGVPLGMPCLP
jgi:translation initiation factor 2B subunit (eIF-2B alpha/beta/delta family)